MLTSSAESNYSPLFKSKMGRIGLMEMINETPPGDVGYSLASMLNPFMVKKVVDVHEYIDMLKPMSQHLEDNSNDFQRDKKNFLAFRGKNRDYNSNNSQSSNRSTSNPSTPNPIRNDMRKSTPYVNPHLNHMNNNQELFRLNNNDNFFPRDDYIDDYET